MIPRTAFTLVGKYGIPNLFQNLPKISPKWADYFLGNLLDPNREFLLTYDGKTPRTLRGGGFVLSGGNAEEVRTRPFIQQGLPWDVHNHPTNSGIARTFHDGFRAPPWAHDWFSHPSPDDFIDAARNNVNLMEVIAPWTESITRWYSPQPRQVFPQIARQLSRHTWNDQLEPGLHTNIANRLNLGDDLLVERMPLAQHPLFGQWLELINTQL